MSDKISADVIDSLAGRDDLTMAQTIALNAARRATEPTCETIERGGWRVELTHHVHTHGQWYATVYPVPNPDYSEICLAGPVSESLARRVADVFLATDGGRRERCQAASAARLAGE